MGLALHCGECGRTGKHRVRMLIVARGPLTFETLVDDERMAQEQREVEVRLGRLLIPHPVVCPDCGAVNAYGVSPGTWLRVLWLRWTARPRWRVQQGIFTTAVGNVHPLVAAIHYSHLLERDPYDYLARVRLISSLSTAGRWAEARKQGAILMEDSSAPVLRRADAVFTLALLAGCENDEETMKELCRRGLRLCLSAKGSRRVAKDSARGCSSVKNLARNFRELLGQLAKPGDLDLDNLLRWIAGAEPE